MWVRKSSSLRTLYEYIPLHPDAQIGNHMLPQPLYIAANNASTFLLHKAHDLNSACFLAMTTSERVAWKPVSIYTIYRTPALPIISFPFNKTASPSVPFLLSKHNL
jgi:hypothetical protein